MKNLTGVLLLSFCALMVADSFGTQAPYNAKQDKRLQDVETTADRADAAGTPLALIEQRDPADTTTSATFVTLESSASTVFSGQPVMFLLHTSLHATGSAVNGVDFAVQIDSGSDTLVTNFVMNPSGVHTTVSGIKIITPTAGAHVINIRWRRTEGAGVLTMNDDDQVLLYAIEF